MSVSNRFRDLFTVVKTTAIGGLFFLLPLIVIGYLLSQIIQVLVATAKGIDSFLPFHSAYAYSILLMLSLAALLALCFLAGIIARRSIALQFSQKIEKYLLIAFPRYAVVKDRLSGNIGGHPFHENLKPVLVRGPEEMIRLGLEVERSENGTVTVYFPGAPDPWEGFVAVVPQSKTMAVHADFLTAFSTMERLGRDLQRVTKFSDLSSSASAFPKQTGAGESSE